MQHIYGCTYILIALAESPRVLRREAKPGPLILTLLQEVAHTPYIDLDILHTVPLKERRKLYDPVPREEENPPNSEMTCRRTREGSERSG